MRLSAGTRIGPYQITAPIGAGGMGEVYKAHDNRLNRDVAVKVLPAEFASDADRLRRFEQEARAVGSLNHPNILTIHDVGVHEGSPYLVSELLEGETLRARLEGGALTARRAVDYALGVARGLAVAHDKAIVHRDLKPENLFVTREGIKILDFGLAKLLHPEGAATGAMEGATLTAETDPGRMLGTVGYMSPEQVLGGVIDHRTDIFAFGVILYEMLAGRRAFPGDSSVDVLHAILHKAPQELSAVEPAVTPPLERLVARCLEKEPEDRFQSTRDLVFHLESLGSPSGLPAEAVRKPLRRRWLWPAIAVASALGAAGVAFWIGGLNGKGQPVFRQLTFRSGLITAARFAHDGESVVYSAGWEGRPVELFTTRPGSPESRSLGLPRAGLQAVSSSGELAVTLSCEFNWSECQGTLARVPLSGGAPRDVLEDIHYADWAPDGKTLAVVRPAEGVYRLEYPPGNVLYQTRAWITHPRFSPDGKRIAFIHRQRLGDTAGSLMVVEISSKQSKSLTGTYRVVWGLAWTPDGGEVWFSGSKQSRMYAVHAVTREGSERVVFRAPGFTRIMDISRKGHVLLLNGQPRGRIICRPPGETKERDLSWLDWSTLADLSADGKTLLFYEWGVAVGAVPTVYLRGTDGSDPVRLGEGRAHALSPDGKWVLALTQSLTELILMPTSVGEARRLPSGEIKEYWWADWFPDNRRILMVGEDREGRPRTYAQIVDVGEPRPVLREGILGTTVSPDGRWIAALNPLDQKYGLWPAAGGDAIVIPGLNPGEELLRWTSDGSSIYIRAVPPSLSIYKVHLTTGRRELFLEPAPTDPVGLFGFATTPLGLRLSADGKAYAFTYWNSLHELYLAEGLR